MKRETIVAAKVLFTLTLAVTFRPTAALGQDSSFDGTIIGYEHGYLTVIDSKCHRHVLSAWTGSGLSGDTLRTWGWQHIGQHVRVTFHTTNDEAAADAIAPLNGPNEVARCEKEQHSFETHTDGTITRWSEGVMLGEFTLQEPSGATRTFAFRTGLEPTIDGKHIYCEDSESGCSGFPKLSRTKVRVFYKIVDSPDGAEIKPLRIEILSHP